MIHIYIYSIYNIYNIIIYIHIHIYMFALPEGSFIRCVRSPAACKFLPYSGVSTKVHENVPRNELTLTKLRYAMVG